MDEEHHENRTIVDLELVETRKVVSPTFLSKILEVFFEEAPKVIQKIKDDLKSRDKPDCIELGHKLKGMCLNVGAMYLSEIGRRLEQDDFDKTPAAVAGLIGEIETVYRQTAVELNQLLDEPLIPAEF